MYTISAQEIIRAAQSSAIFHTVNIGGKDYETFTEWEYDEEGNHINQRTYLPLQHPARKKAQ